MKWFRSLIGRLHSGQTFVGARIGVRAQQRRLHVNGVEMIMATGVVARFDSKRGFGFVIPDGGEDLFVHQNNIVMEGFVPRSERVKFEIEMGDKGGKAVSVELLEERQRMNIASFEPTQRNGGGSGSGSYFQA